MPEVMLFHGSNNVKDGSTTFIFNLFSFERQILHKEEVRQRSLITWFTLQMPAMARTRLMQHLELRGIPCVCRPASTAFPGHRRKLDWK